MPAVVVAPSNFTTARQNLSDGLVAVLNGIKAANPTLLRQVWSSRPGSFPEVPAAYIGSLDEIVTHDSSTRKRSFVATVVLVDKLIDNQDTGNRIDALVDLCVEWFTRNFQIVTDANSVVITALQQTSGVDGEETVDGPTVSVHYANHTMTFGSFTNPVVVQERRN